MLEDVSTDVISIRKKGQRSAIFVAIFLLLIAGCRTVSPIRELHSSYAPDISRVMLKNGNVIEFNRDFGWYNRHAGTIEGVTIDSQHVEYHLVELSKAEIVRTYSVVAAFYTLGAILGFAIYLVARLLALV